MDLPDVPIDVLVEGSCQQLRNLIHRMLYRRYPTLRRWEDTDDVLQRSLLRLHRSLGKFQPHSAREFYALAAQQIRWELIDLCRHYFGPHGLGANYESRHGGVDDSRDRPWEPAATESGPMDLMAWAEFHEHVGRLPDQEREILELLWYHQLTQAETASLLGVSIRTVKRRWQHAKLWLYQSFGGEPPV